MKKLLFTFFSCVFTLALLLTVSGCVSNPAAVAKAQLQFVDLQSFDSDLSGSLGAQLPKVDVRFLEPFSPNALPERLQNWMASVESGGGKVLVVPPTSTVTAKNPLALLSLASTLWSASNMAQDLARKAQFRAAQTYDAQILLKTNDAGQALVDKVVFTQRQK